MKMTVQNTVERLQKLENDIKTVISIYEIAYTTKEEVIENQKYPITPIKLSQLREKASESVVKATMKVGLSTQSVQNVDSTQIKNTSVIKKPHSAPSSSSTLSGIGESDYSCEPQLYINSTFKAKTDRNAISQTEVVDNTNSSEWFDSETSPNEVFMTPSTTLEAAKKMLEKSNYQSSAHGNQKKLDETDFSNFKNSEKNNYGLIKLSKGKDCYTSEGKSEKLSKTELAHSNKKQKKIERSNEFQCLTKTIEERDVPVISKSFLIFKTSSDSENLKSGTLSARNVTSKNISALEKQNVDDTPTNKIFTIDKETKSSQKKKHNCENLTGRKNHRKVCSSNESTAQVKDICKLTLKHVTNLESIGQKHNIKKKQEKSEFFENNKNTERQRDAKSTEIKEEELDVHELCKIIKKSNEKLEKMKVSKELALDIAKQLKHKYEEIRQSKEELIERLNNVERDNQRLSNEVKDAYDSKIKLQMKVKEFQRDSQTVFLEQDSQIRAVVEENKWLKNKLTESELQHTADVLEKQKLIERIREERFKETKLNHKKRNDRNEKDVKTLTDENLQLKAKIHELHLFSCDRQSKVEALEGKIKELQEELHKQTQNLKQKTERLEETNKELESIRKNSEDLEEQVKTLRKNLENFDQLHQNLIKQNVNFEHQIKFKQEEIKTFQDENSKLKNELENEKDSILIKNKIIEDQQETIKQLREKSEEMKIVTKRNHSLERILNIEREEKLELQEALGRLKARKDELKKKIKTLEEDLLLAPQEVVKDLQKTQIVLHELENQVQIKQKEWELHLQSLIKEKEQACSVAEFATRKLMQTTNEFQKQSEAHKRLHRVLAENLARKERNRREANEKENLIKHMTTDNHQNTINLVQPTDKYQYNSEDVVATNALDWYQRNLTSCIDCNNGKPKPFI